VSRLGDIQIGAGVAVPAIDDMDKQRARLDRYAELARAVA
jgi:hypothetical protein